MQIDDVWSECIIYQDINSRKVYVRQSEDFDLKFARFEEEFDKEYNII